MTTNMKTPKVLVNCAVLPGWFGNTCQVAVGGKQFLMPRNLVWVSVGGDDMPRNPVLTTPGMIEAVLEEDRGEYLVIRVCGEPVGHDRFANGVLVTRKELFVIDSESLRQRPSWGEDVTDVNLAAAEARLR